MTIMQVVSPLNMRTWRYNRFFFFRFLTPLSLSLSLLTTFQHQNTMSYYPTSPTSPTSPTAPGGFRRLSLLGGINPNITAVDKDHPLILVDPTLNTVLAALPSQIQESYFKAKHLPLASDSLGFEPVSFTTQEVAGTNYYVKLLVQHNDDEKSGNQEDEYIHVKIFSQPLTKTAELRGIAVNKHLADSLIEPIAPILDEIPDATVH
ncbi:MAG: hypothetical protein J3Q66DRAFT_327484 [Benniella sp.]|nr:MAG: hypothetical protein J3Q66DRAFT_327484 [Benniella sp.]